MAATAVVSDGVSEGVNDGLAAIERETEDDDVADRMLLREPVAEDVRDAGRDALIEL